MTSGVADVSKGIAHPIGFNFRLDICRKMDMFSAAVAQFLVSWPQAVAYLGNAQKMLRHHES